LRAIKQGDATDCVPLVAKLFEQRGAQHVVLTIQPVLSMRFSGCKGPVTGLPDAQGGDGHICELRHRADTVEERWGDRGHRCK